MHVWLHGLRVVQRIAGCIHWRAVRQVADRVGEFSSRQWGTWGVGIWLDGLWMIDTVAGHVQWRAIWQIASSLPQQEWRILCVLKKDTLIVLFQVVQAKWPTSLRYSRSAWASFCKAYGNLMPCKPSFLATLEVRRARSKTPAAVATIATP